MTTASTTMIHDPVTFQSTNSNVDCIPKKWFEAADVQNFLAHFKPLPPNTILVGAAEDGLPVLFNLEENTSSAILLCSDNPAAHTSLLETMLLSLVADDMRFSIISKSSWRYEKLIQQPGIAQEKCEGIYDSASQEAEQHIYRLTALANRRRHSGNNCSPTLLILDDIRFIESPHSALSANFLWLMENGPSSKIWLVLSLPARQVFELGLSPLPFESKIYGHIGEPRYAEVLAPNLRTASLIVGRQYAVAQGQNWLPFWVPLRNNF